MCLEHEAVGVGEMSAAGTAWKGESDRERSCIHTTTTKRRELQDESRMKYEVSILHCVSRSFISVCLCCHPWRVSNAIVGNHEPCPEHHSPPLLLWISPSHHMPYFC
jgi:hypothetical protein